MILEATRIIADWLADATYGVNAVRTTVPKDTGVTDFPAVTVLDSTRDGRVARGGVPNLTEAEFPALLVTPADQPVTQNRAGIQPGGWFTATVLIRYAVKAMDTALAERNASQTIKCVVRQMPLLVQTPAGETLRNGYTTRTEVQFHAIEDLQLTTLYEADTDTLVTGGVLVTCLLKRL